MQSRGCGVLLQVSQQLDLVMLVFRVSQVLKAVQRFMMLECGGRGRQR
jgi:hypothetical protein